MAIQRLSNARQQHSEAAWDAIKPRVTYHYIDQGLTLNMTMVALRREGFIATEKMYKTRVKRWGLKKYMKDEDAGQILQAEEDGSHHRAQTIRGRTFTAEDARRHLKRKKNQTWNAFQSKPKLMCPNIYCEEEILTSPVDDRLCVDALWTGDTRVCHESDEDVEMTEEEGAEKDLQVVKLVDGALLGFSPNLLLTPGLQFVTQSFLYSMREFCNMTLHSVPEQSVQTLSTQRFNELWDLFCTRAAHIQQNKHQQALAIRRTAQNKFSDMLLNKNPWLLISMCLLLNDNMSNPERVTASNTFLTDMQNWADLVSPGHPIAQLIRFLRQSNDKGLCLLEATIRMLAERLREELGPFHDLSLELARLHGRIMIDLGMHSTAEKLLSQDLAEVEDRFGSSSLQNLLRLSSLARCRFMANHPEESLRLYEDILADPLIDWISMADIKYGAMHFVAKSNAQLGNVGRAIAQARETLRFSLETKGADHYWANSAKALEEELEAVRFVMIE